MVKSKDNQDETAEVAATEVKSRVSTTELKTDNEKKAEISLYVDKEVLCKWDKEKIQARWGDGQYKLFPGQVVLVTFLCRQNVDKKEIYGIV